jgi:hypothetical protein
MAWDPALLRKYNATGHFRLLNQLRAELKAHPLTRAADDLAAGIRPGRRGPKAGRSLEIRPQGQGSGRFRRSQPATAAPVVVPVEVALLGNADDFDPNGSMNGLSFRDRLNAIDMR